MKKKSSFWTASGLSVVVILTIAGFYWKDTELEEDMGVGGSSNRPRYEAQEEDAFSRDDASKGHLARTKTGNSVDSRLTGMQEGNPFTTEELLKIDDWYREKGYHLRDKHSDYDSYDQHTLEKLAKGGDIIALQLLASTAEKSSDRMHYRLQAAARGSIHDIQEIANEHMTQIQHAQHSNDEDMLNFHKIQFLAWYEVLEMRGLGNVGKTAKNYKDMLNLTLTEEDEAAILEAANENYRMIETIRKAMGHDSFNNQPPELLEQFFQHSNSVKTQH